MNVIPSDVKISTYARGKRIEGIMEVSRKVDIALADGAISIGAKVEISDMPGYIPMVTDSGLMSIAELVAKELVNESEIGYDRHTAGSTDMGDVSTIMPVVQPCIGGIIGSLHGKDFTIKMKKQRTFSRQKYLRQSRLSCWQIKGKRPVK